jgi:hypothetical protein
LTAVVRNELLVGKPSGIFLFPIVFAQSLKHILTPTATKIHCNERPFYFWVQKIIVADVLNVSKLATTIFNCSDMLAEMRGPPLLFFTLAGC